MTDTAYVKKLDAENLRILMRLDPPRIQAGEATPEAIKTCRMMGVELLLMPDGRYSPEGRYWSLRAGVVSGAADVALPLEAPGSTGAKCRHVESETDVSVWHVWHSLSQSLLAAGYIKGQTYEQCLEMAKWNPDMAEFMTKQLPGGVGSDMHRQQFGFAQMGASQASVGGEPASGLVTECRGVFSANATALKAAGYIKGQTLEQCLEMAKWHPAMQAVMRSLGAFSDHETDLDRQFGFAVSYLEDSGSLVA